MQIQLANGYANVGIALEGDEATALLYKSFAIKKIKDLFGLADGGAMSKTLEVTDGVTVYLKVQGNQGRVRITVAGGIQLFWYDPITSYALSTARLDGRKTYPITESHGYSFYPTYTNGLTNLMAFIGLQPAEGTLVLPYSYNYVGARFISGKMAVVYREPTGSHYKYACAFFPPCSATTTSGKRWSVAQIKWYYTPTGIIGETYSYLTNTSLWIVVIRYQFGVTTTEITQIRLRDGVVITPAHEIYSYADAFSGGYAGVMDDSSFYYVPATGYVRKVSLTTGQLVAETTGYFPDYVPPHWLNTHERVFNESLYWSTTVCGGFVFVSAVQMDEFITTVDPDYSNPDIFNFFRMTHVYRMFVFDKATMSLVADLGQSADYGFIHDVKPSKAAPGVPGTIKYIALVVKNKQAQYYKNSQDGMAEKVHWVDNTLTYDGSSFTFTKGKILMELNAAYASPPPSTDVKRLFLGSRSFLLSPYLWPQYSKSPTLTPPRNF